MHQIKGNISLGLLLIRLAVGGVFIAHGLQKVLNLDMTVGFFTTLGLPAFLAYVVTAIELLGGIAVLLGLWTEIAGILIALVMVGAIYTVKGKAGFFGGYELDLTLMLAALALAVSGPGRYTVKRLLSKAS